MLTIKDIKSDSEVNAILDAAERQIDVLGFTEHSKRHSSIVSNWASEILCKLGMNEREQNLAAIAGYLHDLGNAINRVDHAQSGALLSYNILLRKGMSFADAAEVMMAIGNHDEQNGTPVSDISSALIIADKADVHKSRVRKDNVNKVIGQINIHDRVNLAAESSHVDVDAENKIISIVIRINTEICEIMDYFEIYHGRMQMCRRAANYLGCKFALVINEMRVI